MRRTTRIAVGTFVVLSAAAAANAGAETPAAIRSGATPAFASLPEGHVAPPPRTEPPNRIAASERVDGLVTAPMPPEQLKQARDSGQDARVTFLFTSEDQAKTFATQYAKQDDRTDACMVDGGDAKSLIANVGSDGDADWPTSYQSMLSFRFQTKGAPPPSRRIKHRSKSARSEDTDVHIVHAERFVAGQYGHASLAIADAWVDVRTRGVRLLASSTLPLLRVFTAPNGREVYAARDGNVVQIVVHSSGPPSDDAALADQLRSQVRSLAVLLPDRNAMSSDCGHLRFPLRPYVGAGQMGTLQSVAFLPPLEGDIEPAPEGESEAGRGSRELQDMRQRPFQMSVSATAASTDKSPVVSIALGWIGR